MRKIYFFLLVVLCATTIKAQVNLSASNTITQNFDGMSKTSNATLPSGWKASKNDATARSVGSYATAGTSTTQTGGTFISSSATNGIYNYAAGDPAVASDRAVGGLAVGTGSKSVNIFVDLLNNGADAISGYTLSYNIEKYRSGSNAAGFAIQLYYSLNGTTWTSAGAAFATSFPADATTAGYASAPGSTVSITAQTFNITVAAGAHLYLAWNYSVTSGSTTSNAQGLGIDNISITANTAIIPPTLIAGTLNAFGNVCINTNSTSNSFTLSGSNLDGSQVTVGPLANYTLSGTANGPFTATLSPFYTGAAFSTTIYVRHSPTAVQSYKGNIPVTGGGAASLSVAVTAAGVNTAPVVTTEDAVTITQISAAVAGGIVDMGCSNISSYGIEYSTINDFANGSGTTVAASNIDIGYFSVDLVGLLANTVYYYRAFAVNEGGASYGPQKTFATLPLETLVVNSAVAVTDKSFKANWSNLTGAVNYYLDVATTPDFIHPGVTTLAAWTFPHWPDNAIVDIASPLNTAKQITAPGTDFVYYDLEGVTTRAAWTTGWQSGVGTKGWQLELDATGFDNLLLSSKQRASPTGPKNFKVQYKIGATGVWTDVPLSSVSLEDNFTAGILSNIALPAACNNQSSLFIRWVVANNVSVDGGTIGPVGTSRIDDIVINGNRGSYVSGYQNLLVSGSQQTVNGLESGITYYYRARAFDGVSVSENSNTVSVTTVAAASLPVTLASFNGRRQDNINILDWTTTMELNNKGFEIQRSSDGIHYNIIGFIESLPPLGNSNELLNYNFSDNAPATDKNYYRLRQVDIDGKYEFSKIILIRSDEIALLKINAYPNPTTSVLKLNINSPVENNIRMIIMDMLGRVIKQRTERIAKGSNTFSIDMDKMQRGSYLLKVINMDNQETALPFIKQ